MHFRKEGELWAKRPSAVVTAGKAAAHLFVCVRACARVHRVRLGQAGGDMEQDTVKLSPKYRILTTDA